MQQKMVRNFEIWQIPVWISHLWQTVVGWLWFRI